MGVMGLFGFLVARYVPLATLIPFWGCGFRKLTGIPCPGCGLTRVAERLAHFQFWSAFTINPLGTIAGVCFAVAIIASIVQRAFGISLPELVLTDAEWRRVRWGAIFLFVVNYAWVITAHVVLHFT